MIDCIVFSDFTGGAGKATNGEVISNEVLAAHAAAVMEQLNGPYADAWDGSQVHCRVGAPNGADVGPGEWLMGYWQSPDVAGAAGYHATTPTGQPYGKVFLDDAAAMSAGPQAASVIASHEALEMKGDPTANLFAMRNDGTIDAFEMCDAVEDTTYKASNGIEVSNFLTPAAFDPGAAGPYDRLGVLKGQYDMTPGGYRITGTATMASGPSAKIAFKADGPGLADPQRLNRKRRSQSRASKRGATFPGE